MNFHLIEEDQDETTAILAELCQEKQELKKKLWSYEINFFEKHGRVPDKRDKESVRYLYSSYKNIIHQIKAREGDAQDSTVGSIVENNESNNIVIVEERNDALSKYVHKLKVEKRALHRIIKSYEKEFMKINHHRVSNFRDTQPIAEKYRRYVAVKKELESLDRNI